VNENREIGEFMQNQQDRPAWCFVADTTCHSKAERQTLINDANRSHVRGGPLFCDAAYYPRYGPPNHVSFRARQDDRLQWQRIAPQGHDIGGVSGGPLLMPTLTDQGIVWRFAEVIVESAAGDLFEQIVADRGIFIQPTGRIGLIARHRKCCGAHR
jgi:hypothetical protein